MPGFKAPDKKRFIPSSGPAAGGVMADGSPGCAGMDIWLLAEGCMRVRLKGQIMNAAITTTNPAAATSQGQSSLSLKPPFLAAAWLSWDLLLFKLPVVGWDGVVALPDDGFFLVVLLELLDALEWLDDEVLGVEVELDEPLDVDDDVAGDGDDEAGAFNA